MENTASPWIKTISLPPPSLQDNTADTERLIAALRTILQTDAAIHIDLDLIKKLPDILRQSDFNVRCTLFKDGCQWLVVGIQRANEMRPIAGLAVDLGTSRIVLRLLDLASGQPLAESDFPSIFGAQSPLDYPRALYPGSE